MRRYLVATVAVLAVMAVPVSAQSRLTPVQHLSALAQLAGDMDTTFQLTSGHATNDQHNHITINRSRYEIGGIPENPCIMSVTWTEFDGTHKASVDLRRRGIVSSPLFNDKPDSEFFVPGHTARSAKPIVEILAPTRLQHFSDRGELWNDEVVYLWVHGAKSREQADMFSKLWGSFALTCSSQTPLPPAPVSDGAFWLIEHRNTMKLELGVFNAKWNLLNVEEVRYDPKHCHARIVYRFADWQGKPYFKDYEYYLSSTTIKSEVSSSGTGFVSFDRDLGKRFVSLRGKDALDIGAAFSAMKDSCGK